MSYKNSRNRNTYKKSSSKKVTNRKNLIKKRKKRINKKKLILLTSILFVFIFGIGKLTIGLSQNIKDKKNVIKNQTLKNEQSAVKEEQYNIENTNKEVEKKYIVYIDPGHGGSDPGNLGNPIDKSVDKIHEKDVALDISKKVAKKLSEQNDIEIAISRTDDKYISLEERAKMANAQNADMLVSIHLNGEHGGNSASGLETYYRKGASDDSIKLANIIQNTIISYVDVRNRGVREGNLQVLNQSTMPAVLIECGFLTNPEEEKKLLSDSYQNQLADGIAQGILSYLDGKK